MEILINNNHNVNLGSPGRFFLDELALQYPSLLHIPQEGFLSSFIASLISPLPSCGSNSMVKIHKPYQHHLNNKNTSQGFTLKIRGMSQSITI